jgi:hypothetical protein
MLSPQSEVTSECGDNISHPGKSGLNGGLQSGASCSPPAKALKPGDRIPDMKNIYSYRVFVKGKLPKMSNILFRSMHFE